MNEFDDLFEQQSSKTTVEQHDITDEFYSYHERHRRNGILILIYFLVTYIFAFGQTLVFDYRYPDAEAITDQITVTEAIAINVTDSGDELYPYQFDITGSLVNGSDMTLPQLYVNIEFFSDDAESYGTYTFNEAEVGINQTVSINDQITTDFEYDYFTVSYGFDASPSYYTLFSLLPVIVISFLFIYLDMANFRYDWERFKAEPKKLLGQTITGFFLVYAGLLVANMILSLLGETGTSQNEMAIRNLFNDDPIQLVMLFFLLVVFTPFVEEIVFRKVLYNYVERKSSYILAIIVSGAIFGILHVLVYGDFIQAIPYVVMGIIFGYVYYRSQKNIYVTIGVHVLNNLLSFVVYLLMVFGLYI